MSTLPVEIMEEDEGGTELTMATEEEDEQSSFKESEIVSARN
jgi:hypothetical protein